MEVREMKRHRILRLSFYALTLGVCTLLCVMPACHLFKDDAPSSDAEENVETPTDTAEGAETPTDTEESVETPTDTEESVQTPTDTEENVEMPTDTEASVETPTDTAENEGEAADPPAELLYKKDGMLLIQSEDYIYLARVTKDTHADAKAVPVHIFTPDLREKIGDTVPIDNVWAAREIPADGWGTQLVAVEYFDNLEWKFDWDAREMKDHYLIPAEGDGTRRVELGDVRFPVPLKK